MTKSLYLCSVIKPNFQEKKNKVAKSSRKPFKELLLLLWRQSPSLSISAWTRKKAGPVDKL